jgi:hypothetical protein
MRKILPIFLTLLILGGGFLIYLWFQPKVNLGLTQPSTLGPATTVPNKNPDTFVGSGTGAWVTQFNRDTGKLAYRFKSDFYDPQSDGTVRVTKPVMEFFLADGQIMRVEGATGVVRMSPDSDRNTFSGVPVEPPRYGTLQNVTMKLFDSLQDEDAGNVNMTLTMQNAQFDNDTYRLFTEEYIDPSGQVVHKDEVPVTIRAKAYAFDGSGMVVTWNDLDQRLKSLEIDHGKKLTIYDGSQWMISPAAVPQPQSQAISPSNSGLSLLPGLSMGTILTADVDAGQAPLAPRHRYTATFLDNVRIVQDGQTLIHAPDRMDVDFVPKGQNGATANPSPAPTDTPAAANPSQSSTQKPSDPIDIFWDGKMTMIPTDESQAESLASGQSIISFLGSPVHLHQFSGKDGSLTEADCSKLIYHTADSSARLIGEQGTPVNFTQKREDGATTIIRGPVLRFSQTENVAMVEGEGSAHLPDQDDPHSAIDAVWDKSCLVHLIGGTQNSMQIRRADLLGKVAVDHPRFHLQAQELNLIFNPPTGASPQNSSQSAASQLQQVIATGDAVCVVHETDQHSRSVAGQKLQLFTDVSPNGKIFAKTIQADGSVQALQDQDNLSAEHLTITMAPKDSSQSENPKPEDDIELQELDASESVHVLGANSSSATGDHLKIVMVDGHAKVTLSGNPATATDGDTTITGPEIDLSGHDQISSVPGPGMLVTRIQPGGPAPNDASPHPTRPMKMTWKQSATLDGNTNEIHVLGDVNIESKAPDGAVDLAHGGQMVVFLQPTPTTQPGDQSDSPTPNVVQSDFNFMRNKQVRLVSLRDKAQAESNLIDVDGTLLRRMDLYGDQIDYDVTLPSLAVPGPGRMLVEDHRQPATQPADQSQSVMGGRGTSAFQWNKQLLYDQTKRLATMDGNVAIVHRDDGPNPNQFRVDADNVTAEVQPVAGQTVTDPGDDTPQMQLSHLTAQGNIRVTSDTRTIRCDQADFDPAKHLLICRGGPNGDVMLLDAQHPDNATVGEVWLDTQTNLVVKVTDISARSH